MDHPHSRVMTVVGARKRTFAISRRDSPEVCFSTSRPLWSEGAGKAGCALAPAVSCAMKWWKAHTSIQVQRKHPTFPAQWSYGCFVISPVSPAQLPPSPAGMTAGSTPSSVVSGPYDLAVRFGIARLARRRVNRIPTRVRDVRDTPLLVGRDAKRYSLIFNSVLQN